MNTKLLSSEIRKYFFSKRVTNPINVTLTEKQYFNGIKLDTMVSEQNFKHFKNKLNTKLFGNSYRRFGNQLEMLVIREVSSNDRPHIHCIIEQPNRIEFYKFEDLITELWRETDFGYNEVHIEKPSSQLREDGWLKYIMKSKTKHSLETSIDWNNSTVLNQSRI